MLLLAFGLAGVLFLVFRESSVSIDEQAAALNTAEKCAADPGPDTNESNERVAASGSAEQDGVLKTLPAAEDLPPAALAPVSSPVVRYSTNDLIAILPLWMQERADVDTYADERMVAGIPITRVRGRYAWTNGSQMEVEISDLGEEPSDLLLRSVGYNTVLSNTVTEAGFQLHVDETNELSNFEYDYQTGEGSLQLLVGGRFLVEVQLELLLPESFEAVIDHQVPIAVLEEMAANHGGP